jgi:hypothetical protein
VVLVASWAKREGVVRLGLGQGKRRGVVDVHGPKPAKKKGEKERKKRVGEVSPLLSLNQRQKR